jgi:hypothetical protein
MNLRVIGEADFFIPAMFEGGDRLRLLPPPHEVSHLIGFLQTVHAAPQPVLVAMLARTEVFAGPHPYSAQSLTAEQTISRVHISRLV